MSENETDNAAERRPALYLRPIQTIPGLKPFYFIGDKPITVGRHPSNDISVPVEAVSRFHARIEKQAGQHLLLDLNSSNGTYIGRERIVQAALEAGQTIMFGNVEFSCDAAPADAAWPEERLLKTPVKFVGADQRQSHLILQTEVGKRETVPLGKVFEVPPDFNTLVKAYRKLAILYKLSDMFHALLEEQYLLESFIDLIFEILPADRAAILLRDAPEDELQIRVARSRDAARAQAPIAISRTIIDRCMEERMAILSQDASSDERFKESESIVLHDIRSTMTAPLVSRGIILGVLHVDTRESVHAFNDDDLHFVSSLADELALFLDLRQISDENLRNQEMAAVGEVITDLAHNIKNILLLAEGGIKLMDRLIDEGDLDRVRQNWALTQRTLGRISTMVKEMLDYSRAVQPAKNLANLNAIVRETCENSKGEFERKGITARLRLDRRIEDTLLDAQGLERALVNLLVNACEAIKHDHGEVTVTTQVCPSRDLMLMVEDNGEGIPAAKLPRLFFPMFTTKGESGSGLGLAMVKKWVAAVGGTVRAHSTEGSGSRFVIVLPREVTGNSLETAGAEQ